MEKNTVSGSLQQLVEQAPPGTIIYPGDYLHLGSIEAVHMALSRLSGEGKELERVARGIYIKPKKDPTFGSLKPSIDQIARSLAEKEQVSIRPTGVTALNQLGLSTQVPMNAVYLTDGSPRTIVVGKGKIIFKKITPRKMAMKNDLVFLTSQALLELGKNRITGEVLNILKSKLSNLQPEEIRADARFAPHWVARILYNIADKI